MSTRIMRRLCLFSWIVVFCFVLFSRAFGGEYHLMNGDVIAGTPESITEDGVVFKLDIGGFSPQRLRWTKFTQESLKELAKNPKAARFAEPFIESTEPEATATVKKKKQVTVKPVEGLVPRYEKIAFVEAWTSPVAIMLLLVLYAANLYAAVEIARFRNRPAGLVCGLSAVLPVLGPLVFLSLPTLDEHGMEIHPESTEADVPVPLPHAGPGHPGAGASAGGGLGLAKAAKEEASGGYMVPGVFKRGDYTFNRRFIETKFSGFFRVVPVEAEKDLIMVIRTNKNEFIAKRVSRISSNEMHLQLLRGGVEQMVAFADITELQIRHKDAKA